MTDKICCLFEEDNAVQAVKDWSREIVDDLIDSYRHTRILYRCKKCGGLVLYDYEETAHFLPGEDWDNAYVDESYYPVLESDISVEDEEKEFNWFAMTSRKYITASYRELDEGTVPYYFMKPKPKKTKGREYSTDCPVTVTYKTLPADEREFRDMCTFVELFQLDAKRSLKVELPNWDHPQEFSVSYRDGNYRMRLTFPMEEFGWSHPMVLGADGMTFEHVKTIMTEICLYQSDTKNIPLIVESFKDITSEVYGEENRKSPD